MVSSLFGFDDVPVPIAEGLSLTVGERHVRIKTVCDSMTVTHSMEVVFPTEGAGVRLAVLWFLLQNEKYFSGLRIDFSNCIMPQLLQFFGVSWFVEHDFHPLFWFIPSF
jgi:hypothetical protein